MRRRRPVVVVGGEGVPAAAAVVVLASVVAAAATAAVRPAAWSTAADDSVMYNVSAMIERLLDNYDMRLRPQFGGMCGMSVYCRNGQASEF